MDFDGDDHRICGGVVGFKYRLDGEGTSLVSNGLVVEARRKAADGFDVDVDDNRHVPVKARRKAADQVGWR